MDGQVVVLLAEDEELIRSLMVEVLRDAGFEVIEVEHAEEALIELNSDPNRVHLLFTDIHMPGSMDGLDLAHHTTREWPWIAVLITSGRAAPHASRMPKNSRFVLKPYRPKVIIDHILEMTSA